ncbi:hypothetical protein FGO68_gene4789 [Halteria grandinella]|uniref:Uncharacterized protein n=1 Tax=Halteria grandinella TaxID=5974 RepID=A0A8J8SXC6_HALGN|nr:hypothetical protein FGO68_gene4789 [Halteria grandinella]
MIISLIYESEHLTTFLSMKINNIFKKEIKFKAQSSTRDLRVSSLQLFLECSLKKINYKKVAGRTFLLKINVTYKPFFFEKEYNQFKTVHQIRLFQQCIYN